MSTEESEVFMETATVINFKGNTYEVYFQIASEGKTTRGKCSHCENEDGFKYSESIVLMGIFNIDKGKEAEVSVKSPLAKQLLKLLYEKHNSSLPFLCDKCMMKEMEVGYEIVRKILHELDNL